MGRQRHKAADNTIAQYLRALFARQARLTGLLILIISILVFIASIKFSTERYARTVCNEIEDSARILVETSQMKSYEGYFRNIASKLENQLSISEVGIAKELPNLNWSHYSIGSCSLQWRNDLKAAVFSPSFWAGDPIYVSGVITPKFFRSDLIMFMIAICIVLFSSYYIGTRSFLRKINRKITDPIQDIWNGLRTGNKPSNLEIKEINDLWNSLVEYKKLLSVRNRMLLAKEYYHEVKSPAFYQFNQLKRLTVIDDPEKQKSIVSETIEKADELIGQMEKALKKIATDDFAKNPRVVDLSALVGQKDSKFRRSAPIKILGDKTLVKTLLNNLYGNAIDACGDIKLVQTDLIYTSDEVVLSIKNPVEKGSEIDTSMIFVSGFTSKANGTGLGLSLCQHIVEIHAGRISAEYLPEKNSFEIIVRFPRGGELDVAAKQNC